MELPKFHNLAKGRIEAEKGSNKVDTSYLGVVIE